MDRALSSVTCSTVASSRRPVRGLLARLVAFDGLYRDRARLAQLDDNALADLGLSRVEAEREARRPLWDAPQHWSR